MPKVDKDALWDLPNLQYFVLNGNKLKFLHNSTFEKNEKLIGVAIDSTKITVVPKTLFQTNLLLEVVLIENNILTTLFDDTFKTNTKLEKVSFRANELKVLPAKLFGNNNSNLTEIDFGDNFLNNIPIDFTKFPNVNLIELENNSCFDACYYVKKVEAHVDVFIFTNLTEFQNAINVNCTRTHHIP